MHLEHEFVVAASFEETWRFLVEPERVAPCLPGVTLDSVGGNVFAGRWKVKVGPITITYRGTARLVENDARTGALVLEASGKESRGEGTARATTRIRVTAAGGVTRVAIHTDLNLTGRAGDFELDMIARAGDRIFERFASCAAENIGMASPPASPPTFPSSAVPAQPGALPEEEPAASVPSQPAAPDGSYPRSEALPPAGRPPSPDDELGLLAPPRSRPTRWAVALMAALTVLGLMWRQRRHIRGG